MAIERSIFVTLEMICWFTSRENNVNFTKVIYGHGSCMVFIEICKPWFLVIYKVKTLKGLSWLASSFCYGTWEITSELLIRQICFPSIYSRSLVTRIKLWREMKHSLSEQGIWVIKVNFSEILIKGKGILGPFIRGKIRRVLHKTRLK